MAKLAPRLSPAQIAEVIKTAWDDQPPFNKVLTTHGLLPGQVIALLKRMDAREAILGLLGRLQRVVPQAQRGRGARPPSPPEGIAGQSAERPEDDAEVPPQRSALQQGGHAGGQQLQFGQGPGVGPDDGEPGGQPALESPHRRAPPRERNAPGDDHHGQQGRSPAGPQRDVGMAQRAVERGLYLSFAGTVTFSSAKGLRDALSIVPLDRVLVETDAPYLTPHPWRGAANAPYLVPVTVRAMAHVLGVAVPTLCQAIAANSERLYGPW